MNFIPTSTVLARALMIYSDYPKYDKKKKKGFLLFFFLLFSEICKITRHCLLVQTGFPFPCACGYDFRASTIEVLSAFNILINFNCYYPDDDSLPRPSHPRVLNTEDGVSCRTIPPAIAAVNKCECSTAQSRPRGEFYDVNGNCLDK